MDGTQDETAKTTETTEATEARREAARAELAEFAANQARRDATRRRIAMGLGVVALVLVAWMVNFAQKMVVQAREQDAIAEFVRGFKNLPGYNSPRHFSEAEKLFEVVQRRSPGSADPYVFRSAIELMLYDAQIRKKRPGGPDVIHPLRAARYANAALERAPRRPDPHYYLAAAAFYGGKPADAEVELARLEEDLPGIQDETLRRQWQAKLDDARSQIAKTGEEHLDLLPPRQMMPMFELVKGDEQ